MSDRDRGMTLPELLIAVTISALLAGVLASSLIVTLRQHDNTEGRLNVARAEQNVSMWMPADLASAEAVDTDPAATPCGAATCDGIYLGDGSNVLQLEWTEVGVGDAVCPPEGIVNCTVTRVSYNFAPSADGETYELRRIECTSTDLVGWACSSHVVLRELPGPPGGAAFVAGVGEGTAGCAARIADPAQAACTEPTWVIIVSEPLDPCAGLTGDELTACVGTGDDGTVIKDANRVIVSINGGGDSAGSGGGVNQISITAGGTVRQTISADSMNGAPSFNEARSRCGGPITLIIDQSTSIPSGERSKVTAAAVEFARTLRGTPTEIQVVRFSDTAGVLGDGQSVTPDAGWHEYFDMTESADWTRLETLLNAMSYGGSTNWEDALFRTFFTKDGTTPQIVPETVVFFTDGVPTVDRLDGRGDSGAMPAQPEPYDQNLWQTYRMPSGPWVNGQVAGEYYQPSFNRANYIASKVRAEQSGYVRLIGVGVGGVNNQVMWTENPGAGYTMVWERGYGRYQQGSAGFWSNRDFEQATTFQSTGDWERGTYQARLDYERRGNGNNWNDIGPAEYYPNRTDTSNYRIRNSNGTRAWYDISAADYAAYRSQSTANFQVVWSDTDAATYFTNNTTTTDTDGWRVNGTRSAATITEAVYDAWYAQAGSAFQAGGWTDRGPTAYYGGQPATPSKWRINGTRTWYVVTEAEYLAYHGADTSVNWKPEQVWTWVSKAVHDAGVASNPTGFRDTGSRTYLDVAAAPEFEVVAGSGSPASQYRQRKVYPATGPYTGIDSRVASTLTGSGAPMTGRVVLARLVAGNDTGLPYEEYADGTNNSELANMFVITGNDSAAWAQLTPVLKSIALGECGGTLTISTKTPAGAAVAAPFTYENSAVFGNDGTLVSPFKPTTITTNAERRSKTFDYAIPGGTYITSEVRPQASSVLLRYRPVGWQCRAGARVLAASEINEQPIALTVTNPDGTTTTVQSGWTKVAVRIGANEAVSCTLTVEQVS